MTEQSTRIPWTSPAPQTAALHDPADHQPTSDEFGTAVNEPATQQLAAEHAGGKPAADGDALDASVPGEPSTGIVDRDDVGSPDVAVSDVPNETDGAEGYQGDGAWAVQEPEAAEEDDYLAGGTDTGPPVHGLEEPVSFDGNGSGELLPSDVLREPVLALLDAETTERFQAQWQRLQLRFIDDPHTVTGQAGELVDEVVTALHEAVDRRRQELEDWQSGDRVDVHAGDTERLRVAVRRYRDFLNHLLGQ